MSSIFPFFAVVDRSLKISPGWFSFTFSMHSYHSLLRSETASTRLARSSYLVHSTIYRHQFNFHYIFPRPSLPLLSVLHVPPISPPFVMRTLTLQEETERPSWVVTILATYSGWEFPCSTLAPENSHTDKICLMFFSECPASYPYQTMVHVFHVIFILLVKLCNWKLQLWQCRYIRYR